MGGTPVKPAITKSQLAYETIKVNYAGYWAAEEGRRVVL